MRIVPPIATAATASLPSPPTQNRLIRLWRFCSNAPTSMGAASVERPLKMLPSVRFAFGFIVPAR